MSKSDTWMPLYIGDYLADTLDFTSAEHGPALLLMMHQWQHGSIPTDNDGIIRICRASEQEWEKISRFVLRLFPISDGVRKNRKLAKLRFKLIENRSRMEPDEWREMRAAIFARDDYTCAYCGRRGGDLECDHVHPVARGGTHHPSNLVTACLPCNRSKGSKTVEEWQQ